MVTAVPPVRCKMPGNLVKGSVSSTLVSTKVLSEFATEFSVRLKAKYHVDRARFIPLSVTIEMDAHPTRIVIYACVTDIDGWPQSRYVKIAGAFCENVLNRAFNHTLNPEGYDHIHIPGDFDSLQPLRRWFILDLDVIQRLDKEDVLRLPHQVFLATRQSGEL